MIAALLAQATTDPSAVDPVLMALQAITDFRSGAVIAGAIIVVNALTNLTKLPAFNKLPAESRPFVALALGGISAGLVAASKGATWKVAITAGIAAGAGSVWAHEIVQSAKKFLASKGWWVIPEEAGAGTAAAPPAPPATTTQSITGAGTAALLLLAALTMPSCSLFSPSLKADELACGKEAVTALEGDIIIDVTHKAITASSADWQGQLGADAISAASSLGPAALCALLALARDFAPGVPAAGPGPAPTPNATAMTLACASNGPCGGMSKSQLTAARIRSLVTQVSHK